MNPLQFELPGNISSGFPAPQCAGSSSTAQCSAISQVSSHSRTMTTLTTTLTTLLGEYRIVDGLQQHNAQSRARGPAGWLVDCV